MERWTSSTVASQSDGIFVHAAGRLFAGAGGALPIGLTWCVLWWPIIVGGEVLYARDLRVFTLASKAYLMQRFEAGELPLWTPLTSAGMPFLADVSNQVLYPLNALLWLSPHLDTAVTWFLVAHSLLAFFAFRYLLRVLGTGVGVATWGCLIYGLSGYVVTITDNLNYLPAVVWVPWGLAAFLRGIDLASYRYTGFAAACTACLVLAGDSQTPPMLAVAAVVLSVAAPGRTGARFRLFHLVGTFGIGALLAAVQILPTAELTVWSVRAAGLDRQIATAFSFPFERLWELVVPYLFGARFPEPVLLRPDFYPRFGGGWVDSVYVGLIPVLLAGYALVWRPRLSAPWVVLAILSFMLAVGANAPYYSALLDVLPPLTAVRYPEKYLFWLGLSLCVLAALGAEGLADRLTRGDGQRQMRYATVVLWTALAVAVFAALVLLPVRLLPEVDTAETSALWSRLVQIPVTHRQGLLVHGAAVMLVLLACVWAARVARREAQAALLALAVLDLLWMHQAHLPTTPAGLLDSAAQPELLDAFPIASGPPPGRVHFEVIERDSFSRIQDSRLWQRLLAAHGVEDPQDIPAFPSLLAVALSHARLTPNDGTRLGIHYHNGQVSPLQPASHFTLETDALGRYAAPILRLAGVGYVVTTDARRSRAWEVPGITQLASRPAIDLRLLSVSDPAPFAYLVGEARSGVPLVDMLEALEARPETLSKTVYLLRRPPVPSTAPKGTSVSAEPIVHAERPRPERIVLRVASPFDEGFAVVNESYFPGWEAWVDGEPAPVMLANHRFMAVQVPRGSHRITLVYRSRRFEAGAALSLLAMAVVLWLGLSRSLPR